MRRTRQFTGKGWVFDKSALGVLSFCILYASGFYFLDSAVIVMFANGLDTQSVSIPFHATFLVLSLLSIWVFARAGVHIYHGRLVILAVVFWLLYFARIFMDGFLFPKQLSMAPQDFLKWAIGVCCLPMIAFAHQMTDRTARWVYRSIFTSAMVAGAVAALQYKQFLGSSFGRIGDAPDTVNPLLVGYVGSSLVALAIYTAVLRSESLLKRLPIILGAGTLGVIGLILGTSRGPIVAVLICYLVTASAAIWRKKRLSTLIYFLLFTAAALYFPTVAENLGSDIDRRFDAIQREFDVEGGSRMTLLTDAWSQFLAHPVLGSGLEEANSEFYPHNVIVESFMATGVVGGISFTVLVGAACWRALQLLVFYPKRGWLSILFFHALVASLFSGALYLSNDLWYLIGAIIASPATAPLRHERKTQRKKLDDITKNSYKREFQTTHASV